MRSRCIRDSRGRYQKHRFGEENESSDGFRMTCLNCLMKVFQSHGERLRIEYFMKHVLLTQFPTHVHKCFTIGKDVPRKRVRWRRYGAIA